MVRLINGRQHLDMEENTIPYHCIQDLIYDLACLLDDVYLYKHSYLFSCHIPKRIR